MFSYFAQVAICESVRETIKRALVRSDDVEVRLKANFIADTDSILRVVSLSPGVDTEERLKDFIMKAILAGLRLTAIQREHLSLNDKS